MSLPAGLVVPFKGAKQADTLKFAEREFLRCSKSPVYFIQHYCAVYDATSKGWLKFILWPAQVAVIKCLQDNQLVAVLKARQLGLTWLLIAYALWLMIFRSSATVLLFSRRDDESMHLLQERLIKMYDRLPVFLQCKSITVKSAHKFQLSNGSVAMAFPTTGGDSYTATLVVVDEADLIKNFKQLMASVKPTIDAGGQMVLITRSDKAKPASAFKKLYRAALRGVNSWFPVFLPWHARPGRDVAWYDKVTTDSLQTYGSLDYVHEQYPQYAAEALAPASEGKRFKTAFIRKAYKPKNHVRIIPHKFASRPGFDWWAARIPGKQYVLGADPAEGNPTSDDSAITVIRADTGEEVCAFADKLEPGAFAALIDELGAYFNNAHIMVERNNHGHAVLLWFKMNGSVYPQCGHDGKFGWLSSSMGKGILYSLCADQIASGEAIIHTEETYLQMCSIEGDTLRAPEGEHDDRSDSFALACAGRQVMVGGWESLVESSSGVTV
ncbi:MAG: hypothetical protein GY938_13130 [Ketobacter sp.]|nr:hypothetical protein [Ketobacter sp.]